LLDKFGQCRLSFPPLVTDIPVDGIGVRWVRATHTEKPAMQNRHFDIRIRIRMPFGCVQLGGTVVDPVVLRAAVVDSFPLCKRS
jgi:hypothetical protein